MKRQSTLAFYRLAALQDLAGIEHRHALAKACSKVDFGQDQARRLADDLHAAEARLDAIYDDAHLCPVRLGLAAAIIDASEDALTQAREKLGQAESAERRAWSDWQASRHRALWFEEQAKDLDKQEIKRREERAEHEARSLRLAIDGLSDRAFRGRDTL